MVCQKINGKHSLYYHYFEVFSLLAWNACLYKQRATFTIWLDWICITLRTAANAAGTLGPAVSFAVTLSSPCWTAFTLVDTYQT